MRSPLALVDDQAEDLLAPSGQRAARDGFLATDMYETDTAYVIKASLPGISAEDLKITREGDTVKLEGVLELAEPENATYLFRERSRGRFSRTLPLPKGAQNEVSATLEGGILSLEFPKPAQSIPRTIKVNPAQ